MKCRSTQLCLPILLSALIFGGCSSTASRSEDPLSQKKSNKSVFKIEKGDTVADGFQKLSAIDGVIYIIAEGASLRLPGNSADILNLSAYVTYLTACDLDVAISIKDDPYVRVQVSTTPIKTDLVPVEPAQVVSETPKAEETENTSPTTPAPHAAPEITPQPETLVKVESPSITPLEAAKPVEIIESKPAETEVAPAAAIEATPVKPESTWKLAPGDLVENVIKVWAKKTNEWRVYWLAKAKPVVPSSFEITGDNFEEAVAQLAGQFANTADAIRLQFDTRTDKTLRVLDRNP